MFKVMDKKILTIWHAENVPSYTFASNVNVLKFSNFFLPNIFNYSKCI